MKQQVNRIKIFGWNEGLRKISLIRLISEYGNISLTEAKQIKEKIVDGETVYLNISNRKLAEEFVEKATKLGAMCTIAE